MTERSHSARGHIFDGGASSQRGTRVESGVGSASVATVIRMDRKHPVKVRRNEAVSKCLWLPRVARIGHFIPIRPESNKLTESSDLVHLAHIPLVFFVF